MFTHTLHRAVKS